MATLTDVLMQHTGVTEIRLRNPEAVLMELSGLLGVQRDFTEFLARAKTNEDRQGLQEQLHILDAEISLLRWFLGEDQSEANDQIRGREQFRVIRPNE